MEMIIEVEFDRLRGSLRHRPEKLAFFCFMVKGVSVEELFNVVDKVLLELLTCPCHTIIIGLGSVLN